MQHSVADGVQISPHGHRMVLCDMGSKMHRVKRPIVKCVGNQAIGSLVRETFVSRCSREDVLAPIDAIVPVNDGSIDW
jgi:hypothetical protein